MEYALIVALVFWCSLALGGAIALAAHLTLDPAPSRVTKRR